MSRKQRLELTWIGKEAQARLEPRILVLEPSQSHHRSTRRELDEQFENTLIYGDNLLALRALEQEFSGKIQLVYIDPPFNTGTAFEYYDDGLEHSIWLSLIRERLILIHSLLAENGFIFVHLDHNEQAYAKVLMDEIFGRANFINTITLTTNAPSGFKATGGRIFSTANTIHLYAKNKSLANLKKTFIEKKYDSAYSKILDDRSRHFSEWTWMGLNEFVAKKLGFDSARAARRELGDSFDSEIAATAVSEASRVFRIAAISGGALNKRRKTVEKSRVERDKVIQHPDEDVDGFLILNGEQVIFYEDRLVEIDGMMVPGELITDIWTDIGWTGIANEGGVEFKNGKKPEALLKRIIEMTTEKGDLVLDSFAGSGTTGAVAHKMGRRWIMVELGEHCHTHIIPRMRRVIDGTDTTGISEAVGWKGGGGFRYYRLAPSLIERDQWGQPVISPAYNAAMLAEAMCKLMGFRYEPSADVFWQQGRSSERDFIYTTTRTLAHEELAAISAQVGDDRSLLICCKAFRMAKQDAFPNLTVKKIPNAVLAKCEWGKDDYSLNVANLPMATPVEEPAAPARTKRRSTAPDLFDQATAEEEPGA